MNNNTKESKIDINPRRRWNFFYLSIRMPRNNQLVEHFCIFETGTGDCSVNSFTEYLSDRMYGFSLKNKASNTIKNFHLTFIIRFLNFIFNDSATPLDCIEDLTIDMMAEFLDRFSEGILPGDDLDDWRSSETVDKANRAINQFVFWLCWKKKDGRKVYHMKYIKESHFNINAITKTSNDGRSTRVCKSIDLLVEPRKTKDKRARDKVIQAGPYTIQKLIEVARVTDPMLVFGIVLGAFCGLRAGFITQMHEGRMKGFDSNGQFGAYLDFRREVILRSDNVITSALKSRVNVPVYPGCTKIVYDFYKEHIEIMKSKNLYPNRYRAVFVTDRGKAMTKTRYLDRFKEIADLTEQIIAKEASLGVNEAIKEQQVLSHGDITPHSLRHYFKQLIEKCEGNPRVVQYYLTHASIESQLDYAVGKATEEGLRRCTTEMYKTIKKD